MKKIYLLIVAVAMLAACERPDLSIVDEGSTVEGKTEKTKKFTFTVKGEFLTQTKDIEFSYGEATRGYLAADGQNMTDLWVFDFVDGECVQTLHQSGADDDFGTPSLSLTYGQHHVYFVASRGTEPEVDASAHTITWDKVKDTFWADYAVTVVSTSNGNRAVTLDRVATKLKITATDEVPASMSVLTITPATWYSALNYVTGDAAGAVANQTRSVSVPSSYVGTSTQLTMSIFGISGTTEWTTDLTIAALDDNAEVIGQAQITSAPFIRNRTTEYSGPLFGTAGAAAVSLNAEWATAYSGTW